MGLEQFTPRLKRLGEILAHHRNAASFGTDSEPATAHLQSIRIERIRELTAELSSRIDQGDAFDGVMLQLLLNEYVDAVGHMRAVARLAAARIDGAAMPIKDARRAMHRLVKAYDAVAVREGIDDAPQVSDALPPAYPGPA